jgi:hypothetical protein
MTDRKCGTCGSEDRRTFGWPCASVARVAEAVAQERERCAMTCESIGYDYPDSEVLKDCAAAIRNIDK